MAQTASLKDFLSSFMLLELLKGMKLTAVSYTHLTLPTKA